MPILMEMDPIPWLQVPDYSDFISIPTVDIRISNDWNKQFRRISFPGHVLQCHTGRRLKRWNKQFFMPILRWIEVGIIPDP